MKVDQKIAWECYENILRSRHGTYMITTCAKEVKVDIDCKRHLESIRDIKEVQISEKTFRLGATLYEELENRLKEVH